MVKDENNSRTKSHGIFFLKRQYKLARSSIRDGCSKRYIDSRRCVNFYCIRIFEPEIKALYTIKVPRLVRSFSDLIAVSKADLVFCG
jgi:hypothetical protein